MSGPIARLRAAVRESGSPLAAALGDAPELEPPGERALAAGAGPRAAGQREDVEVAVAAVDEGYRLHYGEAVVLCIDDGDLRLLAGDRMYALGLARLATIGDMVAIAELADVIALGAQAHASGDQELADAVWEAGVAAIANGPSERSMDAKRRARMGDPGASAALRAVARA